VGFVLLDLEKELQTLLEYLSSHLVFSGVRVARSGEGTADPSGVPEFTPGF
jgi:hypothetical protein